jgi:hypothetical protein
VEERGPLTAGVGEKQKPKVFHKFTKKKKKTNPSFSRQTNTEKLTQDFCYVAEKLTNQQKNGMRT